MHENIYIYSFIQKILFENINAWNAVRISFPLVFYQYISVALWKLPTFASVFYLISFFCCSHSIFCSNAFDAHIHDFLSAYCNWKEFMCMSTEVSKRIVWVFTLTIVESILHRIGRMMKVRCFFFTPRICECMHSCVCVCVFVCIHWSCHK